MPRNKVRGVSSRTYNRSKYWSAYIDGRLQYFGKGEKGRKAAEAAKAKDVANKFESREIRGGLKTKKVHFKNFAELADWYLDSPGVKQRARK